MRALRRRSGKGGCPIRSRSVWLTACSAVLAVGLAGCGGGDGEQEPEVAGPRIESATANDLAALSDEVADRLESGDRCGAAESAKQLRDRVTAAINEGKVPELYLEDLSGLANELQLQVPACVKPEPPPPPDEEEEREQEDEDDDGGKGKREGKDKDKKEKDENEKVETIPTVTEPFETLPDETTTAETTTTTTTTTTATPPPPPPTTTTTETQE